MIVVIVADIFHVVRGEGWPGEGGGGGGTTTLSIKVKVAGVGRPL